MARSQDVCVNSVNNNVGISSSKKNIGRKKILNRCQVFRQLQKAKTSLKLAQKLNAKYKKRLQRLTLAATPSPSKKVTILARGKKVPTPVKRRLVFLECVNIGLENKRKEVLEEGSKNKIEEFNRLVSVPDLKRKRLVSEARKIVGTYRTFQRSTSNS